MDKFQPSKIIELRNKHKMSQKVLGEKLGITDRGVSKWETGLSTPSSSHTIGPEKACMIFKEKNKFADYFKVILYGSFAKIKVEI